MKHTPGPWRASPYSSIVGIAITAPTAHVAGVRGDIGIATANAKLIAAAPELLEALKDVLPLVRHTDDAGWEVMKRARLAVEKAAS